MLRRHVFIAFAVISLVFVIIYVKYTLIIGEFLHMSYNLPQLRATVNNVIEQRDNSNFTIAALQDKNAFLSLRIEELEQRLSQSKREEPIAPKYISHVATASRPGVIVLGMHRSGTSVVGGLMSKMGLNTGGPLIAPASDNAKGFFERIDVVLQNDYLMKKQNLHYAWRTHAYDPLVGLKHILTDDGSLFKEGQRALAFLNSESNYPWMLKDPRLCITLRTWLPLLHFYPAILFTYRNPMDVALSMNKRTTENFPIPLGLKLWYVYNKRAVRQSMDLCRVISSHRKLMSNAASELVHIRNGLIECGVPVPKLPSDSEIASFIDVKLQHGNSSVDVLCELESFDNLMPPSSWPTQEPQHIKLYRTVIAAYCALENGDAFLPSFKWDDSVRD